MEQERELEDVEAYILLEKRVGDAERGGVPEEEKVFPLGGAVCGGEKGEQEGAEGDQDLEEARLHLLQGDAEPCRTRLVAEEGYPRQAKRDQEIAAQNDEEARPEEGAGFDLCQEGYGEDRLITDLLEPEPLGDQADDSRQDHEQNQCGDEEDYPFHLPGFGLGCADDGHVWFSLVMGTDLKSVPGGLPV